MAKVASGHVVEELKGEELEKQMRDWKGYTNGLVRYNPDSWLFPKRFAKFADKYYNFEFRSSDVVVMTYPKCGTTWTQEILWTMRNNPNLDHPLGNLHSMMRVPFLEFDMFGSDEDANPEKQNPLMRGFEMVCKGRDPLNGISLQMAECTPEPRTIKTHLPFSLLHPSLIDKCKVVYVVRNPKDVLVSYHHHCRLINVHGYKGTWEEYIDYFLNDDLVYGSYALHIKEAWQKKTHPNLHIMYYEDMKRDIIGELERLDSFLGTNLTAEQIDNVAKHTSFKEMKGRTENLLGRNNPDSGIFNEEIMKKDGTFFRKGETGDWKNKFTPELEEKVDNWTKDNLNNVDVCFKYSI